ncbi:uncharacterized protein DUF2875 [Collimonas sp. PA-H2]|uniref:type VI lipase adapter Tla3 domain-containing protein n=1 Tax=Collimonas sp. PA-H2 TaxID=1881062 RepID=UPI000C00C1CD|nr:DUF2875 family protein [Collimonas sp. PA-H2]PFH07866.1 uncharacterized protein DUF2875 [Collimonas sp. PA-H2]
MPQTQVPATNFPAVDSLELVGVGVSVETWRNHPSFPKFNLWNAVVESNGSYLVSQDPKQYPKNLDESQMMSAKRKEDAVDVAMRDFMDRYPLPIAVVGPAWHGPDEEAAREKQRYANADSFVITKDDTPYTSRGEFSGLLTQSGQVMNSYLNDEPDKLWQTIFSTFDQHTDLPAVGVAAKDGVIQRAAGTYVSDRPHFNKMAEQAYRPKQARTISDSWTFLTLVRRGRIDWLRPFAPLVKDTMKVESFDGEGPARNWSEFDGWKKNPPQAFVSTPFIAEPWTPFQIEQYDHLENLGTLHRPQVVSYLDEQGKPLKAAERQVRMETALRLALAPLKGALPARIFYDYGSVWDDRTSSTRFLPLVQSFHAIDPEFDLLDPKYGYDLARILGDTGAGSPFVAVALASMAGRQSGGATLVANLRRNDGATLLLVTPPSAEQIKKDAAIKRPYFPHK